MSISKLINRLLRPDLSAVGKCPRCGGKIKTRLRNPLGHVVVDGPTVMESKCLKCGYKTGFPVRKGP